jgi:hypothetical protein
VAVASTILDRTERTCDFERSSVGIPGLESTQLLAELNSAVVDYYSSFEKSGEPPSTIKKEKGYTLVADTALNGALAIGATSIAGDSFASFGSSGAVAIDGRDYALFGANNLTTTLSSVTGVSLAHDDDTAISLLYALPADFDSFRSEEGYPDGVRIGSTPYRFTSGTPTGHQFAVYDTGTTKYLHFPQGTTGKAFVPYNGTLTAVTTEASTVDLPTKDIDYAYWRVVKYCAVKLERPDLLKMAEEGVFSYLNSAHIRRNVGKRPMTRPMRTGRGLSRSDVFDA